MSEQSLIPAPEENLPDVITIVDQCKANVPRLKEASENAVEAMREIESVDNEEQLEEAEDLALAVRETYEKMYNIRTEMTKPIDALKKYLMQFEKPLGDDKESEYSILRNKIATYKQRLIDAKKKVEAEAAKKKIRENHLVDIGTQVLENLNKLLLSKTQETETKSAAYFGASTLETFDKRAEDYRKMKPLLKPDEYSKCFDAPYNKEIFTVEEYADIIASLKKVETYEKWNEEVVKVCTPTVNAWRAKIPQLKQNLIDLKNATDQSERDRLANEQKQKEAQEAERRRRDAEQQAVAASLEIQSQASLLKLNNEFVEQHVTQQAGDTGPVKLVLKFTDPKLSLKAFTEIVVHVCANPKFPGFEKKSKDGKIVVDAQGNPEYITAIQWFVDFFLKNCDVDVVGTQVFEQAKVIIRK